MAATVRPTEGEVAWELHQPGRTGPLVDGGQRWWTVGAVAGVVSGGGRGTTKARGGGGALAAVIGSVPIARSEE